MDREEMIDGLVEQDLEMYLEDRDTFKDVIRRGLRGYEKMSNEELEEEIENRKF